MNTTTNETLKPLRRQIADALAVGPVATIITFVICAIMATGCGCNVHTPDLLGFWFSAALLAIPGFFFSLFAALVTERIAYEVAP